MNGDLFTKWVKEQDRKYAFQDRKIALIINNSPAHPKGDALKTLELILLPPNKTSKTKPIYKGVIRTLEVYYRHSLIKRYITSNDEEDCLQISIC